MPDPVELPAPATSAPASARQSVASFLRRNRQRAIAQWEHAVRAIPAAALLDPVELRDHMPALIDRMLELVESPESSMTVDVSSRHAIERLQEGFNLEQVAWEYSALRSTLLRLNDEEGATLEPTAIVLLNDAIDQAVVRAVTKFHRARVRTLEALDRIAREGLLAEPQALEAMLHRLLSVILTTAETVDTCVVFLNDWGGRLVIRAAVGLEQDLVGRFSLAVGEGFAGTIAQTRKPLFTHSAETDPLVRNPVLQMKGVKALYGVPLIHGDEVIGVAKMGSRTASDFPAEDRLILRSTAERAAAFIQHRRAVDDRELLLHVLGHDLRSPLNSIAVGAQLLQRQEHSPASSATISRILASTERMDRLIGDMTDFTQTRVSGTLQISREKTDLGALAEQIVSEAQSRDGREIRLQRAGDTSGEWDRSRLLRVIANLLNNALAYGDPTKPVTLNVDGEDGWVTLSVHNEGDPIPQTLQPLLFDAFKRGTTGAGSGLGLFIVQQIVRAHGGRVDVESATGRGTTFRVRLPRSSP